jgi:Spy/CpxP family protein refolding chaperone
MMSSVQLASLEPVQAALKLTDEQKDKIKDVNDAMREEGQKLFAGGRDQGGDRTAMREKMEELSATATKKLNEVLDEGQQKRLMGIQIQLAGVAAVMDPAVAKELNITDDQKKQLQEASESNRQAMREAFESGQGQGGGREAREKLRDDANKKLMAVLTSDQQAQLESLKGEKIEIDMSALRGQGGRFGGQRGERGNRGERNRGDRNPESNNQN